MNTNKLSEDLIQQLLQHGLDSGQIMEVLATSVLKLVHITHPAGFEVKGKLFNMKVEGILAEHVSEVVH